MKTIHMFPFVVWSLAIAASSSASAGFMLPSGLSPGDTYRIVFVTAGTRSPDGQLADFNLFVTDEAHQNPDLLNLATTWKAIVSTHGGTALSNTATDPSSASQSPIFLIDGTKIADDYGDLWDGTIDNPIHLTQFGDTLSVPVWSGTGINGLGRAGLVLGPGVGVAVVGQSGSTSSMWIDNDNGSPPSLYGMYGMSGILTVPAQQVPEPASIVAMLSLVSFGAGAVFIRRRRAKKLAA